MAKLAASQHGVFARAQALRLGATKGMVHHRLKAGRWQQLARDVFRLAGSPRSWRQTLMAACLAWGVGAVISHRAAAALWKLFGFEPGPCELTVPRERQRTRGPGKVHRTSLPSLDMTTVDGIPVTTPARTLIDLASVVPAETLEEAMDDALLRGIASIPQLRRCLARNGRQGRPGIALIRRLLDARDPSAAVPQGVFERRLLRIIEGAALPKPVLQHRIDSPDGQVSKIDFAYPDAKLAIEADGRRWHSGRIRWERDRARRNRLTLMGWRIIHVMWTDLTQRPKAVTDVIAKALAMDE